jgi:hypothetical protein
MKMKIEIWQCQFSNEWNCEITTTENGYDETKSWAVENFGDIFGLSYSDLKKKLFSQVEKFKKECQ